MKLSEILRILEEEFPENEIVEIRKRPGDYQFLFDGANIYWRIEVTEKLLVIFSNYQSLHKVIIR